jgi:K+-transporting ATPase ATPase C chain
VDTVQALIAKHSRGRLLGLIGEPRVNVLEINLALDESAPVTRR